SFSRGAPAAGFLPRGATSGGGGTGALWRGQRQTQRVAAAPGPTTQEPVLHQGRSALGRHFGGPAAGGGGAGGGKGSQLFSRASRPDGLSSRAEERRTYRQWGGRIHMPTSPMPLQAARPILESTRRRS